MAKLPDRIYIIDPYDEDGNLVTNTEDVCWCQDAVGDENVAYVAHAAVAAALAELEEELKAKAMATVTDGKFSKIGHGINLARIELKATIAKLGLEAQ